MRQPATAVEAVCSRCGRLQPLAMLKVDDAALYALVPPLICAWRRGCDQALQAAQDATTKGSVNHADGE